MKSKIALFPILLFVVSFAFGGQAVPKLRQPKHLGSGSIQNVETNGQYTISVWKDGRWQEAGALGFDRMLRERELDLSSYLFGQETARIRISEKGRGAAHIDSILLGGQPPLAAQGPDCARILKKTSATDYDVLDARGQSFELSFSGKAPDKTLKLAARVESERITGAPFQFPLDNLLTKIGPNSHFYSYPLHSARPPSEKVGSAEYIAAVGRPQPFFKAFAPTGSGHPAGTTYGWVSDDGQNLYVTIDFTQDNTYDGDLDYAKVYVRNGQTVKEFKVSVSETRWGMAHFIYTDKVAYEHKVYDFVIPFSELGLGPQDRELRLAFAAYGTAAVSNDRHLSLAYDPGNRRYLLVYDEYYLGGRDIKGMFYDVNGNVIQTHGADTFWITATDGDQYLPNVAYDGAAQRYLVVWQDESNPPTSPDVYGQVMDASGESVGGAIPIKAESPPEMRPAVADDPVNHRFLVVWEDGRQFENGDDIWGQFVGTDGSLAGSDFIISDLEGDQTWPAVAFDNQGMEYLVVFAANVVDSIWAIAGQLINWDGEALYTETDENFLVSDPYAMAAHPCVTNDNVNHRFFVAWSDWYEGFDGMPAGVRASAPLSTPKTHQNSLRLWESRGQRNQQQPVTPRTPGAHWANRAARGRSALGSNIPRLPQQEDLYGWQQFIYGQLVDLEANLLYGERFLIFGGDIEDDVPPYIELWQRHPAAAFDSVNQNYLLVWYFYFADWEEYYDEYAFVYDLLTKDGEDVEIGFLNGWSGAGPYNDLIAHLYPTLAFNPFCGNFLTAYADVYEPDIWNAIIGPTDCLRLPQVTTAEVTDIGPTSATGGGEVTDDGGAEVTVRGVCWNTAEGPTLADPHTADGSGLGHFTSLMTGLNPGTLYHVRAYATNSVGTVYGHDLTFTTLKQYVVKFVVDGGGTLSGTTVQYVPEGGDCTPVEARANPGNCFSHWTGTGGFATTSANPLTVTNVQEDMTITAHFGTLGLQVQKLVEKAWIIERAYGKIVVTVSGLSDSPSLHYVLERKKAGENFLSITEFNSADLQNNTWTYEDKFLDANTAYTYRVIAYNQGNQEVGRSVEVTIQ